MQKLGRYADNLKVLLQILYHVDGLHMGQPQRMAANTYIISFVPSKNIYYLF